MKVLITEKLSKHRYKTSEGYLICVDAILARTGKQTYKHNQVYKDSDDEFTDVEVNRRAEEVFSPKAIASFENKPITIQHPDVAVDITNHKDLSVGFVRDVRKASFEGKDVLVGNLVITDSDAIEKIEDGLEYLSCGYDCDISQDSHPEQTNIRGNHVALCENPRAGITKILDSEISKSKENISIVNILTDALDSFVTDEQFIFETPEYPRDSKEWLLWMADDLNLKTIKVKVKELYKDDKVYIEGNSQEVKKLIAEYNALYPNRKLVRTTSTEVNRNRIYNKGYILADMLTMALDEQNKIKGGLADKMTVEEIAEKHHVEKEVIAKQLIKGIEVEFEHTHDRDKAKEIAMDHLVEMYDYYDKLEKMEN